MAHVNLGEGIQEGRFRLEIDCVRWAMDICYESCPDHVMRALGVQELKPTSETSIQGNDITVDER